ncbi:NUDIX domain-containing protein [Virgibacillus kimchii]
MNLQNISIAAGVIIEQNSSILLVKEKGHWGLPKGEVEFGEFLKDTAKREAFEETGLKVDVRELAFVTEFKQKSLGHFIQFFYNAEVVGGRLEINDPDLEIEKVSYISKEELFHYFTFRPRAVPLKYWLENKSLAYFQFDLDKENFFL